MKEPTAAAAWSAYWMIFVSVIWYLRTENRKTAGNTETNQAQKIVVSKMRKRH